MNSKVFGWLFLIAILTPGCVTEFKANLPSNAEQILIVAGTIIEDSTVTFALSRSFSMDTTNIPSNIFDIQATVTLIGSNGYESAPADYLGMGKYSMNIGKLDDDVKYGVKIVCDGDTYRSELSNPISTPEIDSVSWAQPEKYGTVSFFVSTHDDHSNEAGFFMWDYTETWEVNAFYPTTIFFDPAANTFYTVFPAPNYFCWRTGTPNKYMIGTTESLNENRIVNQQIYQYDVKDDRFSILYSVVIHQKAISKAAYDYYQNKIKLNEEMGGLFSPQPSEVDGNITCTTNASKKAMGYVDVVKNVTQKRIFVYRSQVTRPVVDNPNCILMTNQDVLNKLADMKGTYADFYREGFRPAGDPNPMNFSLPVTWAYADCTDCVLNGGSKTRPDYWPNNDY